MFSLGSVCSAEESNLAFLRKEHEATLTSLREELQVVQQKCASLQLKAAEDSEDLKELEFLRNQMAAIDSERVEQGKILCSLQSQLTSALESSEHYRWRTTELQHQLESREAKIEALQEKLAKQDEVRRLQSECDKIYAQQRSQAKQTISRVSQRARSPLQIRGNDNNKDSFEERVEEQDRSLHSLVLMNRPQDEMGVRAKVFRHLLARTRRNDNDNDVRKLSLPHDYKSAVSTLPHIHRATKDDEQWGASITQDTS